MILFKPFAYLYLQIAPLIQSGLEEGAQTFLQKYFTAANVSIAW